MKRPKPKQTGKGHLPVQIAFDRRVREYIAAELTKSPQVEEGGKYVGYLLPESSPQLRTLGLDLDRPALVVTDFLPSGPNAVRTAVELQPDGEYQERLFRQLEQVDPEIEHVGTWHSHHCNGLQTLSGGDVNGYHRTVNKRAYRPDYFLASLVTRLPRSTDDVGWIDHFLFARGRNEYYCINDSIQIIDWPTTFGDHTGHSEDGRTRTSTKARSHDDQEADDGVAGLWYETELGRRILSEDKRFFKGTFGDDVTATRRGNAITLTGCRGRASIAVTYPGAAKESNVTVILREDTREILKMACDLKHRSLALRAATFVAFEPS